MTTLQFEVSKEAQETLRPLPKGPEISGTDWADPWAATAQAREEVARNRDREAFAKDLFQVTGQMITDAINKDPAQVAKLRKARTEGRAGKRFRRNVATKSNSRKTPDKT